MDLQHLIERNKNMDNTDMFWDDVYNDDMDVPRWDEDNVMNNKASDKNYVKL